MSGSTYAATGLSFGYGAAEVLHGLDFDLPANGFGALIGPNGSGKSTLLRLLLGRLRPDRGEVRLLDRPLRSVPPLERARLVGYLPQEVQAAYAFTVAQVVLMGRYPHAPFGLESRRDHQIARDCLARTHSVELADRLFASLSGGEKQRVLLASVLAQEPRVLLLDEPTAALDLHHQHEVMDLLCRLHDDGLAIVMVTHDLNLASRYCPWLWLLHRGGIAAAGPPRQVLVGEVLAPVYGERLRVVADPDLGGPLVLPPLPRQDGPANE
jgi:iron complex transport system ATP-binding protein